MHRRTFLGTLSAAGLALTPYVRAQNAPTRIVVGATPGGGTDTISRALAVELGKALDGTFVVDNKPGAGGNSAWYGLLGPAGMDPALAMQISEATRNALRNEGMREKLRNEGLMATGSTPEEFTAFLRQEITRWGKVVEASGATAG